jgi:hypothetical protein
MGGVSDPESDMFLRPLKSKLAKFDASGSERRVNHAGAWARTSDVSKKNFKKKKIKKRKRNAA